MTKSNEQKEKEKTPPPAQVEEKKVYKMEIKKKDKKPGIRRLNSNNNLHCLLQFC